MRNRNLNLEALITSAKSCEEKISPCKRICAAEPRNAKAWCYLGYLYDKKGEPKESVRYLQKALSIRPDYVDALNCLGNVYMGAENFNVATELFNRAISIKPDHVGIVNNLGRALNGQGRKEPAVTCFRRALEISPSYVPALTNLGQILHETMRYDESIQYFKRALAHAPNDPYLYSQIGSVYKNTGNFDRARESYNKALRIKPDLIEALGGIAAVLEAQGKHDGCHDLINAMSEDQRQHPIIAIIYSGLCHRFGECDDALQLIGRVLDRPGLDNWSKLQLNFSAGNICNRMQKYAEAFEYFVRGNGLKICDYRADEIERLFGQITRLFTKDFLARMPASSNRSEKPVFIVGMPRSGTTLVEQILASHPDVHGAGELPYMGEIYPRFIRKFIPEYEKVNANAMSQDALNLVSNEYLVKLDKLAPDSPRVTDKMPYNFFRLGLIQMLFPGARVIHCSRDPMDVCLSCFFHDFQGSHDYAYDLSSLGHYYRQYVRLMQHWRSVISLPILDISYESIIADTEAMARKLVDFCGLEWNERCLSFHENTRFVATASKNQVNKPIYSTSVKRWKHYDKFLGELKEALGEFNET